MVRFALTRIAMAVPTFVGITMLAFFLIRLVPGDPIETMAGERGVDPARHEQLRREFGFDRPLLVQYGRYVARVLRDAVCADFRLAGGHRGGGAQKLDLRSRSHGGCAHRIFDADLLVGAA